MIRSHPGGSAGTLSHYPRWGACADFGSFSVYVKQWRDGPVGHFHADSDVLILSRGGLALGGLNGVPLLAQVAASFQRGESLGSILSDARGLFLLLAVDRLRRRAAILVSKTGMLPLYQRQDAFGTAVSSSLLGIVDPTSLALNRRGVADFVHFGSSTEGHTIFEGTERFAWPVVAEVDDAGLSVERQLSLESLVGGPESSSFEACKEAILAATSGFVGGEGGSVAALTAGTDSRTVLGALVALGEMPSTFTRDHVESDVRQARKVAQRLGLKHEVEHQPAGWVNVGELNRAIEITDGSVDPFSQSLLLPALQARADSFGTFFGGAGGPLFKDHFWLYEANRVDRHREPNWGRLAKHAVVGYPLIPQYFGRTDSPFQSLAEAFLRKSQDLPGATNNMKLDYVYYSYKQPTFTGPSIAVVTRLMDSVEPLLDVTAVAQSVMLPTRLRKNNILQFKLVEQWLPNTCRITTGEGLPFIPPVGVAIPLRALRLRRVASAATRKARVRFLRKTSSGPVQSSLVDAATLTLMREAAIGPAADLADPASLERSLRSTQADPEFRYLCAVASVNLITEAARVTRWSAHETVVLDPEVQEWFNRSGGSHELL